MQERINKTIMCSVLFLDIVEYSKKSVAGQISLKERFNSYLSTAIHDVPVADRIILDTGDGAAINFLGDVEDALKAALSLRESLLGEDPSLDPPLLVRMGVNLGPVRLVRDINGQPNIVGDGINVAQRVMGFADASQILVSRSYYDAVSRLSPTYAGMFHYQGSRTDKHVREHEIYAIGYPGDQTAKHAAAGGGAKHAVGRVLGYAKQAWGAASARLDAVSGDWQERYRQADSKRRAMYVAGLIVPLLLVGALVLNSTFKRETALPAGQMQGVGAAVPGLMPPASQAGDTTVLANATQSSAMQAEKKPAGKADVKKINGQTKPSQTPPKAKSKTAETDKPWYEKIGGAEQAAGTEARVTVSCKEGTQVFVDGSPKGKVSAGSLTVSVSPATKHTVIVSHPSGGIYTQNVELAPGRTLRIRPGFCD